MKFEIEYTIEEVTCYRVKCSYALTESLLGMSFGFGGFDSPLYTKRADAERVAEAMNADVARKVGRITG